MIRALTNISEAIAVYGIPHQNKEEDEQTQHALLTALSEIEINSNQLYLSHVNHKMAQKSFGKFYTQLRILFNSIYHKKKEQVDPVIIKFHELFNTYEELYSQDMDLEELLTDYQYQLLRAAMMDKFPALKEALCQKGIPDFLLSEIQSVLDSHFNSTSTDLRYHHYLFFNKLIQSLEHIAQDSRDKDWDRRFVETMININFNHMGFFNRCTELIEYRLQDLSKELQIKCIDINTLRISQASRDPKLHFDPTRWHLADLLIYYSEKKKTKLIHLAHTLDNKADEIGRIISTLTRNEIIVYFHYIFKAGLIKGKSKLEAAKSFAEVVNTSKNMKIPITQLVKFDRKKYPNEIKTIRKKLLK